VWAQLYSQVDVPPNQKPEPNGQLVALFTDVREGPLIDHLPTYARQKPEGI